MIHWIGLFQCSSEKLKFHRFDSRIKLNFGGEFNLNNMPRQLIQWGSELNIANGENYVEYPPRKN